MVKVPEYEMNVAPRPAFRAGYTVRASAEDFGAGIGRGMQNFAQGVGQAANVMAQVQALDDGLRVKEADNQFAGWLRERMYGEGGYMTLEGKAAVDGRKTFEQEVEQKRREFGATLPPTAARRYEGVTQERSNTVLQQSIVHSANGRKKWFNDASQSRMASFADDALENYQTPALVEKNVQAGVLELRQRGQALGWDADTTKLQEEQYVSGVYKSIATRMAQTDPVAAQRYANENEKYLTGEDRAALGNQFAPLVIEEEAKAKAGEFMDGVNTGRIPSNRFAAADLPAPAYGLLGVISGTESPDYRTINGGEKFDSYADHPRRVGAGGSSTAAGRYQFVQGTWDRAAGTLRLNDFSPESQDKAAWWLAQEDYRSRTGRELTADLQAGNYSRVRAGLSDTWEGLAKLTDAQFAARMSKASGVAAVADPTAFLDGIANPAVRQATAQRLQVMMALQEKQRKAQAEAIKTQAFAIVDQGGSPDQIPAEVRSQLGREEMTGLWSYYEKTAGGGRVMTDEETLYDLQSMFAQDPAAFSEMDLFKYRDRLSKEDWTKVAGWRQTALTDMRKAKDEGAQISTAMELAGTQLEAVGITTTGKKGDDREEAAKRIAAFQTALANELQTFRQANNGKQPTQPEIQQMVNKLLLPVVIKTDRSALNPLSWIGASTSSREGFAFEAGARPDNATVDVNVKYEDIPLDLRRGISLNLERELGRKPSSEEIVQEYENFILNR